MWGNSEGMVAKSYMTNSILIHKWINFFTFPHILGSPSSYMTLQPLPSEFPYIWGKFIFLFYQCGVLHIASLAAGTLAGCGWQAGDACPQVAVQQRALPSPTPQEGLPGPSGSRASYYLLIPGLILSRAPCWVSSLSKQQREQQMQSRHKFTPNEESNKIWYDNVSKNFI